MPDEIPSLEQELLKKYGKTTKPKTIEEQMAYQVILNKGYTNHNDENKDEYRETRIENRINLDRALTRTAKYNKLILEQNQGTLRFAYNTLGRIIWGGIQILETELIYSAILARGYIEKKTKK